MTTTLEPGIAITVVCVAQLRPLIGQIWPKGWSFAAEPRAESDVTTIGRAGRHPRPPGASEVSVDEWEMLGERPAEMKRVYMRRVEV